MPGFNTIPGAAGGGGAGALGFVASVHMETYNRSWARPGTAGYYALYSQNQESGYAYFVGTGVTTGVALNRMANVTHSFTRIDIIAPTNDLISLYKVKVKATTVFNDPFAAFSSFPAVIRSSGNFVLPNNALPLVNLVVSGAGGHGGGGGSHNGAGGGGGGGGVVKLTAFQAVGTTGVTIAGCDSGSNGGRSSTTYFGNVYALGGGAGGHRGGHAGGSGANGGGGTHNQLGGLGITQTASTGLGTSGSPIYYGGHRGGNQSGGANNHHSSTGGGGGASGQGGDGSGQGDSSNAGPGGRGHISNIEGGNHTYGAGGAGGAYSSRQSNGWDLDGVSPRGHGGPCSNENGGGGGDSGTVVVRYYIP